MRAVQLWWSGVCVLLGCSADKPGTTPSDTPVADNTGDADIDADSDADTDTDTDVDTRTVSGTVDLVRTRDTQPDCHAVVDLVGAAYTGDCPSCEFAFEIDASALEDCDLPPWLSFLDDPVYFDTKLAFASTVQTTHGEELTNALLFGTSYDLSSYGGQGIYPGPYWSVLRSDGDEDTFSFDGTTVGWSWPESYDVGSGETPYGYYDAAACDHPFTDSTYGPSPAVSGSASADGEVDCHGLYTDVFTFDARAGDTIAVSVDTLATETAFDPVLYVSGPDGCALVSADENFSCAWPPPTGFLCPSATFDAPVDGTYRISVLAFTFGAGDTSSCAGSVGAYDLQVDAPRTEVLGGLGDDLPFYEVISRIDLQYSLSATLLP